MTDYKVNVSDGLPQNISEAASKGVPAEQKAAFIEEAKKTPGVHIQVNESTHEIDVMKVLKEG